MLAVLWRNECDKRGCCRMETNTGDTEDRGTKEELEESDSHGVEDQERRLLSNTPRTRVRKELHTILGCVPRQVQRPYQPLPQVFGVRAFRWTGIPKAPSTDLSWEGPFLAVQDWARFAGAPLFALRGRVVQAGYKHHAPAEVRDLESLVSLVY